MDLEHYRASEREQLRTSDLLRLIPQHGQTALDIGARDGHFSRLLAERFDKVVALDLTKPPIEHPRIECVAGDATRLQFGDNSFDFVFCAEVLEHIPSDGLNISCSELARVTRQHLLIGVPYQQDLRVAQTTCSNCGTTNPPWGHVNRFDENRLQELFSTLYVETQSYVGETREITNWVSAWLMNIAGNPYGTYDQDELCVHCGLPLTPPPPRTVPQRILTRIACTLTKWQQAITAPHANWLHGLYRKPA
mgnify:CR=1 FL=1